MKTIPYIKKITSAKTEYRKTTGQDMKWVLDQCRRLVEVAEQCEQHGIKEGLPLNHPRPDLPRMSNGKRNSPKTMCEGVAKNFTEGQYDLSDKQCDGLKKAFEIGNAVIEDFECVDFEEVTTLPKLKSTLLINNADNTIFSDLFEISITVRAK